MSFSLVLLISLPLVLLALHAHAFDFAFSSPTSCDPLSLTWSGGNAPFQLLITPLFYVPINITIPDSAVDSESGNASYTIQQLNLTPGQKFLLTMSDSSGFNAGGTSDVLQVGSSTTGASCNTTYPNPDFFFQLNTALQQCRTFTFSDYSNATQPVRILGLIPLGQAFELDPPEGETSFNWTANVESGTSISFLMTDADDRQGGSSDLKIVGETDDSSCIDASSPHSTISATSTQTGQATATQTVAASGSDNMTGAIVGGTLGGLSIIVIAIPLALYYLRRHRKKNASAHVDGDDEDGALGGGGIMRERNSNHPPPTAVIGVGRNSRISRVRSSLIPTSRFRRQNRSFDLLPGTSTRHNQNRAPNDSVSPMNYLPSPYIFPSSAGAANGHSDSTPSPHQGAYAYEPQPQSPAYTSSGSHTHSRSHSRSHSGDTHAKGYGQGYAVGGASPTSPVSPTFSITGANGHRHSRRSSKGGSGSGGGGGGHSRTGSHLLSATSISKTSEAGLVMAGSRQSQQRFILHRDAEDMPSDAEDNVQEVVELPPQYSDRRSLINLQEDRDRSADEGGEGERSLENQGLIGGGPGSGEGELNIDTTTATRETSTTEMTTTGTGMTTTNESETKEGEGKVYSSLSAGSSEEYAAPRIQ